MISAVVFIFWPDEEFLVETCLKTLSWADEIIVIDNGATEKTVEIVKKYTKNVVKDLGGDFSSRHNLGRKLAKNEWILYVDADERVSYELKEEILNAIASGNSFDAYKLHRIHYFLGKKVRYGDRYPDLVTRLFKKDKLDGWTGIIHESSNVKGEIGILHSPFYHMTHRNIYSMVEKTIVFAEFEAKLRFEAKHPQVVWWRLIRIILTEFWIRMIKYQGWRQGVEGWIDGLFQMFSMFVVYARLWEMQRKESLSETYQKIDEKILKDFK